MKVRPQWREWPAPESQPNGISANTTVSAELLVMGSGLVHDSPLIVPEHSREVSSLRYAADDVESGRLILRFISKRCPIKWKHLLWSSASFVVINTRLRSPHSEEFHQPPSLIQAEGFHG
jgi:hypothetical protein